MSNEKGFYADFVCKQVFFEGTDADFNGNLDLLFTGLRSKLLAARSDVVDTTKVFDFDIKGCELTGFGWK